MYSYIKGIITEVTPNYITIENNGIGYLIKVPNPYQFQENTQTIIYLYQHVREDAIILYGFSTLKERDTFILLISVKGLGPKGALAILASATVDEIATALNNNNSKFFLSFPGIGQKLSQQIILDLKGKVNGSQMSLLSSKNNDELVNALLALGYKQADVKKVVANINDSLTIEEQIKEALKLLLK